MGVVAPSSTRPPWTAATTGAVAVVATSASVRASLKDVLGAAGGEAAVVEADSLHELLRMQHGRVVMAVVDTGSVPLVAVTVALRRHGCRRFVVLAPEPDSVAVALAVGARCFVVTGRIGRAGHRWHPVVPPGPGLSPREVQVVTLVAAGRSNQQTGEALGLSGLTVKNHLARVARRLGTHDRAETVMVALRSGAID